MRSVDRLASAATSLESERAFELAAQVRVRCEILLIARPTARDFAREMLHIERARWHNGAPTDRFDVVQSAFWRLCPVSDR